MRASGGGLCDEVGQWASGPVGEKRDAMQTYRDLIVWRKAIDLVEEMYRATKTWPREEIYGLSSQVRRAIVSVPAKIAEGQGLGSSRDFLRFLAIANGSLIESETHLFIARRLGYLEEPDLLPLLQQTAEVSRLLQGLIRSLQAQIRNNWTTVPLNHSPTTECP
jgi:four helix bundle protein